MGKITNIILNSTNKTSGTVNNNLTYYVDWSAILNKNKKYKLQFNYMGGYNHTNSYRFPYIVTNIPVNNYTIGTSTNYNLGNLKYIIAQQSINAGSYQANFNDNVPLYLQSLPFNNNLNIQILDNISNTPFNDEFFTVAGTGTLTSSGNVFTIVTSTAGLIQLGTVITVSGNSRTIISFLSGTGGVGTYQFDGSAISISTATAFTFPENLTGNPPSNYILSLSFEEQEEQE
jgi:hypothetical protein